MKTENFSPRQALNKPNLCQVEKFQVFLHTKTMIGEFNISENGRDNPKNSC
ncbi:MAG: type II restriction endonuclease [Microcystis aeruginosa Ma_MB_F_20061100_S20]|uniref:Type II restriction endonuclease n=1 Tax=Microcystis aeruginosa Ma_MB_F_20061100_S20D TaxID=2486253 RepID=A0A552F0B1_MICAE|nr:MAG: type II restriction endonuclease [Microcystis aeruginosa Ma_MB_F_20061100_S20]TRU40116.1 MAG: type II restriction endonuclease [Microcystis aeruginosa Ma_MB_F_20061100_S20D]